MIKDGRAYGIALAVKHVLALIERKGVVTTNETTSALDAALEELGTLKGAITPEAAADAGNTVGLLYSRN
jgi:hypothetical protein